MIYYVRTVLLFCVINIPSLKLLISSSALNLIFLFGLVLLLFNRRAAIEQHHLYFSGSVIVFCILTLAFIFPTFHVSTISEFLKYVYATTVMCVVILIVKRSDFIFLSKMLMIWAVFLAIWKLVFGINYSAALGQTYLTYSTPMGAGLAISLYTLLSATDYKTKTWNALCSLIVVAALTTSFSRSALLFPVMSVAFTIFASSMATPRMIKRYAINMLVITVIGLLIIYGTGFNIELKQAAKVLRLVNSLEDEPRFEVYATIIQAIAERPFFGYGTNGSVELISYYPHNFILESLINMGLFGTFFIVIALMTLMVKSYRMLKIDVINVGPFVSVTLFYLLQWSTSYSLVNIYIPLILAVTLYVFKPIEARL